MWKLAVYLLPGIILLAIGAYFLLEFTHGSESDGRQRASAPVQTPDNRQSSSLPGDARTLGAASVKEYGVLVHNQPEGTANVPEPARPSGPPAAFEHVAPTAAGGPNHFLHKRLSVKTYQAFEFVVPPHSVKPRIEGTFRSVAARGNPGDDSIELLLMNDQEFDDFINHKPESSTFSEAATTRGEIRWALGATFSDAKKYHLVFQNPSERQRARVVEADFTISFE